MRTNAQLIKEMVKRELMVSYAESLGLEVSDEEVKSFISQHREALKTATGQMIEIQNNLIKKSGKTEDEYWASEATKDLYKRWLIIGKITDFHKFTSGDEYEALEAKLLKDENVIIKESILLQLN
jgi:hypothetical protein